MILTFLKVWPKGKVVFPDFLRTNASAAWQTMIQNHYSRLPFDGLWIVSRTGTVENYFTFKRNYFIMKYFIDTKIVIFIRAFIIIT